MMEPLIDTGELQRRLGDPGLVVVDCRHSLADTDFGEQAYQGGHIPGAVFLHLDRDLSGTLTGRNGRHPLPSAGRLAERLGQVGIDVSARVVAYDDAGGPFAARLWWLLRWLGHDRVSVLDGGLQAWVSSGGALESGVIVPRALAPLGGGPRSGHVVGAEELPALQQSGVVPVDARSPDRFRGENETLDPVGGHIPGAVNRFFRDNLTADGRFKAAQVLRQEWLALLGAQDVAVVDYCGSGVTACHNQLARAVAGWPPGRLYAGSWSEWCADPSRPLAVG